MLAMTGSAVLAYNDEQRILHRYSGWKIFLILVYWFLDYTRIKTSIVVALLTFDRILQDIRRPNLQFVYLHLRLIKAV